MKMRVSSQRIAVEEFAQSYNRKHARDQVRKTLFFQVNWWFVSKGRGSICKIAEVNMAPTRLRQKNMGGSGKNGSDPSCAQVESGVFLVQMLKKNFVHVFCFHFRHLFQGGESIVLFEPPFTSNSSCLFHS